MRTTYPKPPTREQLERRLKRGEILEGSDAVLAADYQLGRVSRTMHNTGLDLIPNGVKASVLCAKFRRQKDQNCFQSYEI